MSKTSARRVRRKAHTANVHAQARDDAYLLSRLLCDPLPNSMVPVRTFKVQIREGEQKFCFQNFACMPTGNGRVALCTWPKRGARSVGQWAFDNATAAEAWAHQYFGFNGCAIRA